MNSLAMGAPRMATPTAGRLVMAMLDRLEGGSLVFTTPAGLERRFGAGGCYADGLREADLNLRDWSVCRRVMTGGDIAFAEAFMDGHWETTDLVALLTLIACNQRALEHAFYGHRWRQFVPRSQALTAQQQPAARAAQHRHALRSWQPILRSLVGPER